MELSQITSVTVNAPGQTFVLFFEKCGRWLTLGVGCEVGGADPLVVVLLLGTISDDDVLLLDNLVWSCACACGTRWRVDQGATHARQHVFPVSGRCGLFAAHHATGLQSTGHAMMMGKTSGVRVCCCRRERTIKRCRGVAESVGCRYTAQLWLQRVELQWREGESERALDDDEKRTEHRCWRDCVVVSSNE